MATPPALEPWIEQRVQRWPAERLDAVLQAEPLQALGDALRELLDALERCDTATLLRPLGWWQRLTGERDRQAQQLRAAQDEVEQRLAQAQACADAQNSWHAQWQELAREHAAFVQALVDRIRVEQRLLALDAPDDREARARALDHAQQVLNGAEQDQQQLALLQQRHVALLTRFHDVEHSLIPQWRDQLGAAMLGGLPPGEELQAAVQARADLQRQLRQELDPAEGRAAG